ncbi:MAG: hypothetical protein M0Z83_03620 [Betaproteobacteria bacterium]|nr:hypothetical protein [Betaproteobacteria bacterium]
MNITLADKPVEIRLSRAAKTALAQRTTPLLAEMELLFSCLIRKKVRFYEQGAEAGTPASKELSVRFRPVMTSSCTISTLDGPPPCDDFPIKNVRPYIPHWLSIDFRKGQWLGEFGY